MESLYEVQLVLLMMPNSFLNEKSLKPPKLKEKISIVREKETKTRSTEMCIFNYITFNFYS